jgi:hypothetical protein
MGPKRSEPRANHSPNVAAAQDPRRQGDHPSVTKRFSDSCVPQHQDERPSNSDISHCKFILESITWPECRHKLCLLRRSACDDEGGGTPPPVLSDRCATYFSPGIFRRQSQDRQRSSRRSEMLLTMGSAS